MNPIYVDVLGYVSATLTTCSFVPQAWMTWKSRSAHGVSLGMYSIFILGISGWLAYGVFMSAPPIVISNLVTLALALFIFVMKLRFG